MRRGDLVAHAPAANPIGRVAVRSIGIWSWRVVNEVHQRRYDGLRDISSQWTCGDADGCRRHRAKGLFVSGLDAVQSRSRSPRSNHAIRGRVAVCTRW